jgi:hypothetical protein
VPPRPALLLALLLIACLLPGVATAQAWVPEPGHGYVKGDLRWLPGLGYHPTEPSGPAPFATVPEPFGSYHEVFVELYGELGIAPGVAASLSTQGLRLFFMGDPRSGVTQVHASFGEPELEFRFRILQRGPFVLTVDARVKAPTGNNRSVQPVIAAAEGHEQIGNLRISSGAWEAGGGVHAGLGLPRLWLTAGVSLIGASGGWDRVIEWYIKLGRPLKKRWEVRLRLAGRHPLGDGTAPYHDSPSGIGNGTRYLAFTAEWVHRLERGPGLGFSVAGAFATSMRQTSGPAVTLFVEHDW